MNETTITAPPIERAQLDDGMTLAYRELGSGPPVLLIHGWPTTSYLWRGVMPAIAERNRVIAIDLPGFGDSDKPAEASYGFEFFEDVIEGFLASLEIDRVALAGHDISGPVVVHWTLANPERVSRIALLNTLLYPEFAAGVFDLVKTVSTPELRDKLTSPEGLADAIREGFVDESRLTDEALDAYRTPYKTEVERRTLARAAIGLEPGGFEEIAARLPELAVPVRGVYGTWDRILTDVAQTFARLAKDAPEVEVTPIDGRGHFVQDEEPEKVAELLAAFFAEDADRGGSS